jgi:hypothetical protein
VLQLISQRTYRGAKITPAIRKADRAAVQARSAARTNDLAAIIAELKAAGIVTSSGVAKALTERGITTARGDSAWSARLVQRLLSQMRS